MSDFKKEIEFKGSEKITLSDDEKITLSDNEKITASNKEKNGKNTLGLFGGMFDLNNDGIIDEQESQKEKEYLKKITGE